MSTLISTFLLLPRNRRRNAQKLIRTTPHGIDDARNVRIGGIEQWLSIRGDDRDNPVLLFLHGGPGAGQTMFTPLLRPWETHFTLVQWDQRGAGKTRRKNGALQPGELTLEQLEQDGIEVVDFLRHRVGQAKIVLVASSVGSTFGTAMAQHRPDLFHAFVGTDFNPGGDARARSYQLTLARLRALGNRKGVQALETIGPQPAAWTKQQSATLDRWAIKATPNIPDMVLDVLLPALVSSPAHTLRDFWDLTAGMNQSMEQLYGELVRYDARTLGMTVELPFFLFQGDSDGVTPTAAAHAYFDDIRAPHKEFVPIRNAGHLATFARPEQFLQELITRVRPFAPGPRNAEHSVPQLVS